MFDYYYNHLKIKYGDRCNLLYTDTDSLLLDIKTKYIYADMARDANLYHFSNYPKDHFLVNVFTDCIVRKKQQIRLMNLL